LIEARIFDLGKQSSRDLGVLINEFGGSIGIDTRYDYDLQRGRANRSSNESVSRFERDRERTTDFIDSFESTASSTDRFTQTVRNERSRTSDRDSLWGMAQQVVLNPFQLSAVWQAIDTAGDGKVVSQPVIVVGDHNEAVITVATLRPVLQLRTTFIQVGDSIERVSGYEWQILNIGLSLWVVPEISPDGGHVRLSIHPVVTEPLGQDVVAPDGSSYPILSSRELDTRVSVPDRHTLLLGGLIRSEEVSIERKVPLLGDIPVLGALFRYRSRATVENNLVILITPTILDDEEPLSGYELPTLGVSNPMLANLGRNLPYDAAEIGDPMIKFELNTVFPEFSARDWRAIETDDADWVTLEEPAEAVDLPENAKPPRRRWFRRNDRVKGE
jgi:type II secretory pathway component GspD/PulD (secretin)